MPIKDNLMWVSNIILFCSEADKQTTDRRRAIYIFCDSWLRFWFHWSRTHSRGLRFRV